MCGGGRRRSRLRRAVGRHGASLSALEDARAIRLRGRRRLASQVGRGVGAPAGCAAQLQAQRDPAFTAQWKTAAGAFATIGAAQIEAVALAVAAHIQVCFGKEAEVVQAIDNHVIDSFAQIDAAFEP